jgi:hypothetical protein
MEIFNVKIKGRHERLYSEMAITDIMSSGGSTVAKSDYTEYCLLHYVPNVADDESIPIAALLIVSNDEEGGSCDLWLDEDWQSKVRLLDPYADLVMLEALFTEIRDRLSSEGHSSEMLHCLEDSFSNTIQISQRRKCTMAHDDPFARSLLGKALTKVA